MSWLYWGHDISPIQLLLNNCLTLEELRNNSHDLLILFINCMNWVLKYGLSKQNIRRDTEKKKNGETILR